jgi:hypothetical protein
MDLSHFSPSQLSAFWAGVTGVTAVVTGVVAIATLLALKRDSRDRSRPVVVADLLPIVLSRGTAEFVVQNVGQSVAKNVRLQFTPPITEEMGSLAGYLARRYSKQIPTLGPARRLTNIYAHWTGDGSYKLTESVPLEFLVEIAYEDSHSRTYVDKYELSMSTLRNETTSTPSNTDEAGMQRRAIRAWEEIARGVHR